MHRKLPKASNLANTINVVQGQMLEKNVNFIPTVIIQLHYALWKNAPPSFFLLWIMERYYRRHDSLCQRSHIYAPTTVNELFLKRRNQLAPVRIRYYFIGNLYITDISKTINPSVMNLGNIFKASPKTPGIHQNLDFISLLSRWP